MPRSKSLAHFPTRYLELIAEVAVENKSIEVDCASASQCASFRGHWYSFIGALKSEAKAVRYALAHSASPMPDDAQENILRMEAQAQRVMLTILADPPRVLLQNRDNSWQAKLIASAKVTQGPVNPLTPKTEDIASRLLGLQKEQDNGKT